VQSYESVIILDSQLEDEPIEKEITRIEGLITARKGEVIDTERWGRKKLSYEMKGRQQGFYALFRFKLEPKALQEMSHTLKLNERVLRQLTTQMKKHDLASPEKPDQAS